MSVPTLDVSRLVVLLGRYANREAQYSLEDAALVHALADALPQLSEDAARMDALEQGVFWFGTERLTRAAIDAYRSRLGRFDDALASTGRDEQDEGKTENDQLKNHRPGSGE